MRTETAQKTVYGVKTVIGLASPTLIHKAHACHCNKTKKAVITVSVKLNVHARRFAGNLSCFLSCAHVICTSPSAHARCNTDAMLTWVLYNPLHQLLCLSMSQINVSPLCIWMQRGQGPGVGVCTLLLLQDQSSHENLKFRVKHYLVALLDLCSSSKLLETTN